VAGPSVPVALGAPRPPCPRPRGGGWGRILLVLPCNGCVRLGDYMLCSGWGMVWRWVWDLVLSGLVGLAAVDSCKPGLVYWGEELGLSWCDLNPRWSYYRVRPWRLEALSRALEGDLLEASTRYKAIAYYVDVKAYRIALARASRRLLEAGFRVVDAGPEPPTVLGFRSRKSLSRLRAVLEHLLQEAGTAS